MGCGTVTLKSCIGLIGLFFWACAVTLIVIGTLILAEYGHISELAESTDILVPSMIVIGAGVVLCIVGIVGCVGGMKGNKAALTIFFILTLIILVGEGSAIALGYTYRQTAQQKLTHKLHEMVEDCAGNSTVSNATKKAECDELEFLQTKFKCCGADTYEDWYKWSHKNYSIPQSCCRQTNCHTPPEGTNATIASEVIYTEGCSTKVIDTVMGYFTWIFVATVVVAILQVLGLVATCILLFRSQETPYLSLDSQGYRV